MTSSRESIFLCSLLDHRVETKKPSTLPLLSDLRDFTLITMAVKMRLLPTMIAAGGAPLLASMFFSSTEAFLWPCWLVLFVYIFYSSWLYPVHLSPLRKVPTVPGFPLWGQFIEIMTSEIGVPQRDWHQRYGPIVRYYFPFGSERLSVVDSDAIKRMTITNPYNYPKQARVKLFLSYILGDGLSTADGKAHIHQRKALAPSFSTSSVRSLTPIFWEKALRLSKLWEEELLSEQVPSKCFEVLGWLNRTTLDIIGKAGLGTEIDSLTTPETALREAYQLCFCFDFQSQMIHTLAAFFPLARYLPAKANRDLLKSRNIILAEAASIIKDKKANVKQGQHQKDIIGLIVKDNIDESNGNMLSFNTMRDQVMNFLAAG